MNLKQDTTLDILYTNKLKYFQNKFNVIIPKLNKKIEELNEIKTPENEKEINSKICDYESKIKLIINEKNKYFLDNSKYLFEYFLFLYDGNLLDVNIKPKKH